VAGLTHERPVVGTGQVGDLVTGQLGDHEVEAKLEKDVERDEAREGEVVALLHLRQPVRDEEHHHPAGQDLPRAKDERGEDVEVEASDAAHASQHEAITLPGCALESLDDTCRRPGDRHRVAHEGTMPRRPAHRGRFHGNARYHFIERHADASAESSLALERWPPAWRPGSPTAMERRVNSGA
jgi:hypothetical protein